MPLPGAGGLSCACGLACALTACGPTDSSTGVALHGFEDACAGGCPEGEGTVEVVLRCDEPVILELEAVTLRTEELPWEEDWTPLERAADQVEVDAEGVLVASGRLPTGTWVHVFPDVAAPVRSADDLELDDIVEPIAARFGLEPDATRRVTIELLVLEETPEGPGLFAVGSTVD